MPPRKLGKVSEPVALEDDRKTMSSKTERLLVPESLIMMEIVTYDRSMSSVNGPTKSTMLPRLSASTESSSVYPGSLIAAEML